MVAPEDNQGVVLCPALLETLEHCTDAMVDAGNAGGMALHQRLPFVGFLHPVVFGDTVAVSRTSRQRGSKLE